MTAPEVEQGPTLGEVFRGLGRLEKTVDAGFKQVTEQFERMRREFVPRELYDSEMTVVREQLAAGGAARRFTITTAVALLAVLVALAALITPFVS